MITQTIDPRVLKAAEGGPVAKVEPAPIVATATPPSPIAFIDLKTQQDQVRDAVERRLIEVLDHGAYINGPEVKELENALCDFTGAPHALAVSNGTDALVIPMMGLGVGPGDAVFVPAFTYNATANAVLMCGATPVFVDIHPHHFTIDIDHLEATIAAIKAEGRLHPKMIIAVDLFGIPCNYDALHVVAAREGMHLMADAAQSFGARYKGQWAGNLAPVTGTSFFPAKPLGCYGDGGAIFFKDKALYDVCESIRWHGTDDGRKESVRVGMNGRLDSMQCAIVTEKLKIFATELTYRQSIARTYNAAFAGVVDPFIPTGGAEPGWGLYTIAISNRDRVAEQLKANGVPTSIYYKQTLPQMGAFKAYARPEGCPQAENMVNRVLSLPMHPYMTADQVHYVIEQVLSAVRG
jgi:dTDP-4-amino-4,6-dideoxygalactose transaminase